MTSHHNYYSFGYTQNIKTSKPGKTQQWIKVHKFSNPNCCAFNTLAAYLGRTEDLRSSSYLWISFKKLKLLIKMAGIDVTIFSGHSTRKAAPSKANNMGVGLHTILANAGWNSESNFKKFYLRDKLGEAENSKKTFATAVFSKSFCIIVRLCQD